MDGVESLLLDNGRTIREYATCIEYLTTDFNPKSEKIFDYDLSIVIQLKKFCYNIVVTNRKQKEKEKTYFIDGHPVHVLFRVFDKEKIYEILNTLSKKDYTNNRITDEDVVKFSYSIAFAKDNYAKDYLEKSVELFCSIEKINQAQNLHQFFHRNISIQSSPYLSIIHEISGLTHSQHNISLIRIIHNVSINILFG